MHKTGLNGQSEQEKSDYWVKSSGAPMPLAANIAVDLIFL